MPCGPVQVGVLSHELEGLGKDPQDVLRKHGLDEESLMQGLIDSEADNDEIPALETFPIVPTNNNLVTLSPLLLAMAAGISEFFGFRPIANL